MTKTANEAATAGIVVGVCIRCQGAGVMEHFGHVRSGVCFGCAGDGVRLYMPRAMRAAGFEALSRAVRIEIVKQCLAAYTWTAEDHFTAKNLPRARKVLRLLVVEVTAHGDLDVFDRAFAALGKIAKLSPAKVAKLRERCAANAAARASKVAA